MRWLFRFNVADERLTGSTAQATGLGHAVRCLNLAAEVQRLGHGEVFFLVEGDAGTADFLRRHDVPFLLNGDEAAALDVFRPSVIVVDINYLPPERIEWYRRRAPVINLAPRGLPKYFADVTFNPLRADDVPRPSEAVRPVVWHRGPEYAVVGPSFRRVRGRLDTMTDRWRPGTVVCMGGVDQADLTGLALRALLPTCPGVRFKAVLGPFYPHWVRLDALLAAWPGRCDVLVDPPDLAEEIARSALGVFGAGVVAYEALAVGVPSVNVGLAPFHRLIGEELEALGVALFAGSSDRLAAGALGAMVGGLLHDAPRLEAMRRRALALVDGQGARRIVEIVAGLRLPSPEYIAA